jgi:quinol monooxygenase YgiN
MSRSEDVVVVARWETNNRALGAVLEHVAELRQQSLEEPGCLGYEVFHQVENPTALLLLERYRDETSLEAHRSSKHYRELVVDLILPMLESRQLEILKSRD